MGDCCTVVIETLPRYRDHFEEVLGSPDEELPLDSGTIELTWYEVNYGFSGDQSLEGIPYLGGHTVGDEYCGSIFCSDGITHLGVPAIDGQPCQTYIPNPESHGPHFVPENPKKLAQFFEHYAKCHKLIFNSNPETP